MSKNWYKSKTLWASAVTILGAIGALATGDQTIQEVVILVIGAVFAYLRTITDSPLTK